MMNLKNTFAFLLVFASISLFAQNLLIPFKINGKFGLVDENDNMVMEPKYDELYWLGSQYFQGTQALQVEDVLKTDSGDLKRDQTILVRNLIENGKELIQPGPYVGFQVVPHMMFNARYTGDSEKLSANQAQYEILKGKKNLSFLFNLKGENLEPMGFHKLEFIDSAGTSMRNLNHAKYALLLRETIDHKFEICVYDSDNGNFKECLLKDAIKFKVLGATTDNKSFYLSFTNSNNQEFQKKLSITKDYFLWEDFMEKIPEKVNLREQTLEHIQENVETNKNAVKNQSFNNKNLAYSWNNGKLFYQKENEDSVEIKIDGIPIFQHPKSIRQNQNLIYKKDNKFGILIEGIAQKTTYDSLAYFGSNHFLVCNKSNNTFLCGTLDQNGSKVIPIEYESILGQLKTYTLNKKEGKLQLLTEEKSLPMNKINTEINYLIRANPQFPVYKNGKVGILNLNNQIILPIEYDEIGTNGIKSQNLQSQNYIVLKKGNEFGAILMHYDPESKETFQEIIEPIFPEFPAYLYKDYYGNKGFNLFGLINEFGKITKYASEFGRIYEK